jgi:alkylation response protein AidB-like acyl-CoA dehydrogenase
MNHSELVTGTNLEPLAIDTDPAVYRLIHDALDEPATDNLLTERERQIRAKTRDLVATEVAPRAAAADRDHEFVHDSVQALMAAGLCGLLFPERLGGTADTTVSYAIAMEEITAACAATSLVFMTQMHAAYPIYLAGDPEIVDRYVPPLIAGTVYGSLAVTEPDAGSDVSGLRTTASRTADGSGYRLNGSKTFITTGDRADVIVCFTTVDRSLGRRGITAFVLDGNWSGIRRGRPFDKLGMHGSSTAELAFDDVAVPARHRLGGEGEGWAIAMSSVVKSRISAAAQGVGLARAAYARALVASARIDGPRIADEASFALAGLRSQILQGRLLLHAVAREIDRGPDVSAAQVAMMKQACTDLGWQVGVEAARLLGPYGDLAVFGIDRCLRDARVTQIYDGTNEIQRLLIGREAHRLVEQWS